MSRISLDSQTDAIRPAHKIFHTSQSETARLGRRIGAGAEGEVYEVQDKGDLVAKIYYEPPPPEKAEKLVVLSRLANERLFNLSAWPVTTLSDTSDGEVIGFVMKKISHAEEVHALHSPKSRLQKFPEASWAFLIYVAANIARAVAAIHEHGLVIGDVNPKNILVTRKATVYLLDVDSFQVSAEGKTYRCEGGFPEYTPPELQGVAFRDVDRSQEHDSFGLAVVIFQLLFMGRHPFSGRYLGAGEMPLEQAIREFRFAYGDDAEARKMQQPPGTLELDSMPSQFVDLFRRAFLSTDRPRPREWIEQLDALAKALKKCDQHSGHYYYRELRDCPWCGIEYHARVRLFNFLMPGDDSRRGHFRLDEIWREIASVETPGAHLIRWDKILAPSAPSVEVSALARDSRTRFILALIFSVFAGLAIPLLIGFPFAFVLLILSGLAACAIGKVGRTTTMQLLFSRRQPGSNNPLLEKVQSRWRQAEEAARRLQERYDREAGNDRWGVKRDELLNRKETYENLAQIRKFRLQQLEAEARKNELEEFLDQFKINDAEIKGIVAPIKTALLSHGVETAADVIEEVKQITSVGRSQAERLLEWRRDLERRFVFDPTRGVPPEARFKTERDIDALRFRLESELIGGAHYLRQVKQEIETSRQKLRPVLTQARQELAQAEKDLQVASRRNSPALILTALIIAFFIGGAMELSRFRPPSPKIVNSGHTENQRVSSGSQPPPPASATNRESWAERDEQEYAMTLYRKGVKLSQAKKFAGAVKEFQAAIKIDSQFYEAREELGYALYRLKRYEESAEESKAAIRIHLGFKPFYNLGLVHYATENWNGAMLAFRRSIELRELSSWKDEYTEAYYYLGLSLAKLGKVHDEVKALEADADLLHSASIKRFELANLYLCAGWREAAKEQYRLLQVSDRALAKELLRLMKRHGVRRPA
jgi:DNA-binding helix-hairpin-helix protein with protein kinase domain